MLKPMPQAFRQAMPGKHCQRSIARVAMQTRQDKTTKTTTTHLSRYLTLGNARRGAER